MPKILNVLRPFLLVRDGISLFSNILFYTVERGRNFFKNLVNKNGKNPRPIFYGNTFLDFYQCASTICSQFIFLSGFFPFEINATTVASF